MAGVSHHLNESQETTMSCKLDPELVPAMAALAAQAAEAKPPARGDWRAVRAAASRRPRLHGEHHPLSSGVTTTSFSTPASDGQGEIGLRWYTTASAAPGPAVVYAHGGGMLAGSVDLYDEVVSWYAAASGVPFLSVELRLAPEATSPASLAEDVFSGLTWLAGHATDLGVDPSRIAVMGDSGGGGPAAGAAILARDRGVPAAKQILIYPCSMTAPRHQAPCQQTCSPGATTTTTPAGLPFSAKRSAQTTFRPSRRQPGSPTSPGSHPPTLKSATSTSSETRASPTPSAWPGQEYPSNSTSTPAPRMASSASSRTPT